MAKKKKSSGFNMAAEIRGVLEGDRKLSGKEVLAILKKKHPKHKFNDNSFGVAFYGARNKMGITSKRGTAKKRTGAKKTVIKKTPVAAGTTVDIETLQRAAKFVSEIGDAENAIEAVRQLRTLQIG